MLAFGRTLIYVVEIEIEINKTAATSLATWHVRIPFKIIIELSVRRSDHQEIAGDLEGARVPPR